MTQNDQEPQTASDEAAAAVWQGYDPELKAAIVAGDPIAERVYRAETTLEELRRQKAGQP
jgi:hypothetical protein